MSEHKGAILLSAGGTGGHLFPAEALAHELIGRGWTVHLATDERAERYSERFPGEVHLVRSATIGGRNPIALWKTLTTLFAGYRQSVAVLNRLKPKAVIGFGGYPTLPPVFAATRRGVPSMVHEQNAVMGRANKALAARVDRIAGGFLTPQASGFAGKTVQTGNPVRPAVLDVLDQPYAPPGPDEQFRLLVFGGSQGAQYFGEALPLAIELLPADLRQRMSITQQARADDEDEIRQVYARLGVPAEVSPFFSDMAARIAGAHLVISRAGASTVSELAAIGRPAILVPYPHALDHDQSANAAALQAAGGCQVREQRSLSPEMLAGLIAELGQSPSRLADMAAAAKATGRPNAAVLLADEAEAIASR
ncbi:undecaprenyldiphospho-muramoylpentapeptide beta-N-acetylglucosaminyltransferase [Notoacmeibacter ruber]|uniref:UDP-N-acetylglucosamine--N-acetylmuramyl-(pentapeptide) pyrophosphoryl-undecaprenol N-acetylglucosamine transferase n=1 Tax=Notoacmeibacter ruber TaxID=2670375 RepID=A0A3L7JI61_9HYPH|nr:undecaprenyldiphospho-muramoylpentapeptide beta-N-acetylglucosaminyltransferase [Notoacmeibacter ruber]RLQ88182.1 undecaprenyldiphospho-muramoylpentapeptide beta-N-acetylglucosaminyltransferase [Notoacmeibacter ruber]